MIVYFDSLNRFEKPDMMLCNPGARYLPNGTITKTIGTIIDTSDEELSCEFNAVSEFNFRVNHIVRGDIEKDRYTKNLFDAIKPRRLIFLENIGFFAISEVKEVYDNGSHYKDVTARSCESEIENRTLTYIENGTYPLVSDIEKGKTGLLNIIVSALPFWKIGFVDDALTNIYRTFDEVDIEANTLSFLLEDVQKAYECIFVFDIIHRSINAYSYNNYSELTDARTSIHLSRETIVNSVDIKELNDETFTALSVYGEDNMSISAVNPLGGSTIYNFRNYYNMMSEPLRKRVSYWQSLIDDTEEVYYQSTVEVEEWQQIISMYTTEIERKKILLSVYRTCLNNIEESNIITQEMIDSCNDVISANSDTEDDNISLSDDINELKDALNEKISYCMGSISQIQIEVGNARDQLATAESVRNSLSQEVRLDTYFTAEEYEELCCYMFEGSYTDEHIIIGESMDYSEELAQIKSLYEVGKRKLQESSVMKREMEIDVENFIFQEKFAKWSKQLHTGCYITIEASEDDASSLLLLNYTLNYSDKKLTMKFSNSYKNSDAKSVFGYVLGGISRTANSVGYVKDTIYPLKNGVSAQRLDGDVVIDSENKIVDTCGNAITDVIYPLGAVFLSTSSSLPSALLNVGSWKTISLSDIGLNNSGTTKLYAWIRTDEIN